LEYIAEAAGSSGGLFPTLQGGTKERVVKTLLAEQRREEMLARVQEASRDFGDLAAI
jgi:hypothetical protein